MLQAMVVDRKYHEKSSQKYQSDLACSDCDQHDCSTTVSVNRLYLVPERKAQQAVPRHTLGAPIA